METKEHEYDVFMAASIFASTPAMLSHYRCHGYIYLSLVKSKQLSRHLYHILYTSPIKNPTQLVRHNTCDLVTRFCCERKTCCARDYVTFPNVSLQEDFT